MKQRIKLSMGHHHHEPQNYNKAFAIGVILNMLFVIIEAIYGYLANSVALIADAGHNFSDVISLLLAWGAAYLATKSASARRTYGFRRVTIIASMISAVLLFIALGGIAYESIGRLQNPAPVSEVTVIVVASIGVVINTVTALLFVSGQKHDLNLKGAYLHMAADAAVSLGVVIAAVVIMATGWLWLDPLTSLAIVVIIVAGTWGLFRDSLNLSIDAVPADVDVPSIERYLLEQSGVDSLHDLHVWALSTTETALTVHLVINETVEGNAFLQALTGELHDRFDIEHATVQLERVSNTFLCPLDKPRCL